MRKPDKRVEQSRNAIKDGLLSVLEHKPLAQVSVAEVVKASGVSRSTFYVHYNNLEEVFAELGADAQQEMRTLKRQLGCVGCEGTRELPFCALIRHEGRYAPLFKDEAYLRSQAFVQDTLQEGDVYEELAADGLDSTVAKALFTFQMNGCYAVAKSVPEGEDFSEIRKAIDVFIAGGLRAVREKCL